MDDQLARLLEAHVRHELDRWQDGTVHDTVIEEVAAAFAWLEDTSLRVALPPRTAQVWVRRLLLEEPVTDELFEEILWSVRAAHESLLKETEPLSRVLPPERYEQLVSAGVDLQRLRSEVIAQGTRSAVYAELISHVLYHGLKNYVLTQNAIMRHLPGASSLLRMGQSAVRSVTPNLEAGIDRQLLAFVASSVAETVHDSRAFLEQLLDDPTLRTIADEIWAENGQRSVGEIAAFVEDGSLDALVVGARDVWLAARSSPAVTQLVDALVEQFYAAHADEPLSDVLAALGMTREKVMGALTTVAVQVVPVARDSGHLEAYVRRRLTAFYASYSDPAADPAADPAG